MNCDLQFTSTMCLSGQGIAHLQDRVFVVNSSNSVDVQFIALCLCSLVADNQENDLQSMHCIHFWGDETVAVQRVYTKSNMDLLYPGNAGQGQLTWE